MEQQNWRKRLVTALVILFMAGFFFFALFPILWIVLMSLKDRADIIAYPPKFIFSPTLQNYGDILLGVTGFGKLEGRSDFLLYFKNTLIISTGAVILAVLVGVPASYALARYQFPGKEDIAFTFLSFRFAPELAVVIPVFIIFQQLHLYDTYFGLILIYQLIAAPLLIWVLRGYFEDIPVEVEQAAMVDGYGWWGIFSKIALPLVLPGLAAAVILAFIFCWNNFAFGLILAGRNTQPLTLGLLGFFDVHEVKWGQLAAATIITIVPELIMAFAVLRYLIRGLTFGAVRG
jgi:multiple sugar transport system permease protein